MEGTTIVCNYIFILCGTLWKREDEIINNNIYLLKLGCYTTELREIV